MGAHPERRHPGCDLPASRYPLTCPHGNPIPGNAVEPTSSRPLNELDPGESGRITRVAEATESRPDMLAYLHQSGLLPGALVIIVAKAPDGAIAVEVGGATSVLAPDIACSVHVTIRDITID